jgi:hypothetical protein
MQMIADVSVRLSAKRFSSLFKVFLVTIIQIDNGSAHTQKKKDATLLLHVAVVREMSPLCTDATTLCFLVGQFFFSLSNHSCPSLYIMMTRVVKESIFSFVVAPSPPGRKRLMTPPKYSVTFIISQPRRIYYLHIGLVIISWRNRRKPNVAESHFPRVYAILLNE